MAFNQDQVRKARAAGLIVALVAVIVLAVAVFSGALGTPKAGSSQQGAAGSETAQSTEAQSGAQSDGSSSSDHTVADVDAENQPVVEQLETRYEDDPSNPTALLNLANGYFDWGVAVMNHAQTDEDDEHVVDLFSRAIAHYDDYLEQYGSENGANKAVQVDRAISIFYTGDHERAIQTLEDFTAEVADFGPAWANLGMFYENDGRTDDARAAYERALEADDDNAYGVRDYAEARLEALDAE